MDVWRWCEHIHLSNQLYKWNWDPCTCYY
jgi:hypothetical protein